jgi:hypothetical protein
VALVLSGSIAVVSLVYNHLFPVLIFHYLYLLPSVNRLNVHFECSECPFAVAVADKAVGIVGIAVADKAVGIVVAGKAVGIAGIVVAGKAVVLAATSCLVELVIPSLMTILIIVTLLLKFSFRVLVSCLTDITQNIFFVMN